MTIKKRIKNYDYRTASLEIGTFLLIFILFLIAAGAFDQ